MLILLIKQPSNIIDRQTLHSMKTSMDRLRISYGINIKTSKLFPIWHEIYYLINSTLNPSNMDIDNSLDSEDSIVVQRTNCR